MVQKPLPPNSKSFPKIAPAPLFYHYQVLILDVDPRRDDNASPIPY